MDDSLKEESSQQRDEIWCLKRTGQKTGWLLLQDNAEVSLGRGLDVTHRLVSLTCPFMISRNHCLLKQNEEGQWTVTDKKSLNGVWLNRKRIESDAACMLNEGDIVQLGVPIDNMGAEFEYIFTRDKLQNVLPFLLKASKEDVVDQRIQSRKRKFHSLDEEQVRSVYSKAKISKSSTDGMYKKRHSFCTFLATSSHTCDSEVAAGPSGCCDGVAVLSDEQSTELSTQCHINFAKEPQCTEQSVEERLVTEQQQSEKLKTPRDVEEQKQHCGMRNESKHCYRDVDEIIQAKEKELQKTKVETEKAIAQKEQFFTLMTDVLESELQCAVCSELFIEAVTLNCAHSFCFKCISDWRKRKDECPICRQAIVSQTNSLVLDNYIDRIIENLSPEMKKRRESLISERKAERQT
ncbi:E3 ubiquitin-protein ligase rnf8 [Erpetoichthys calabaricus]|uniref:E3 ubiquitin-protein ligase CHFR n=1 Tax=Erpetoichthys calabaricus TaxID=27687 RepID=A0A8C4SN51_ERPCA|nr:E3 ubiquitin-protein ligase rnf8 [Erpetoichthys calabaricus]